MGKIRFSIPGRISDILIRCARNVNFISPGYPVRHNTSGLVAILSSIISWDKILFYGDEGEYYKSSLYI